MYYECAIFEVPVYSYHINNIIYNNCDTMKQLIYHCKINCFLGPLSHIIITNAIILDMSLMYKRNIYNRNTKFLFRVEFLFSLSSIPL